MTACPISLDVLGPAAKKAVDPSTPVPARMMAAKGMAPMPPKDLVLAQYVLTFDADAKVVEAATGSLKNLNERIANAVLSDPGLPGPLLGYLAETLAARDAYIEKLILNPSTPSSVFAGVAAVASEKVCEIIANNQARLLAEPRIAKGLLDNPSALKSTQDRVIDFLVRAGVVLEDVPEFEHALLRLSGDARLKAAESVELPKELLDDRYLTEEDKAELGERRIILDEGEQGDETPENESLEVKLRSLTIGQKVALATKGNRSIRSRLMRDANRVVAIAAISSPTVTEKEAIEAANSRVVHKDVIEYIGRRKEWIRLYPLKLALAQNPKTGLPVALKLVSHLNKKDLKSVSVSKNVPSPVRTLAGKMLKSRGGGGEE